MSACDAQYRRVENELAIDPTQSWVDAVWALREKFSFHTIHSRRSEYYRRLAEHRRQQTMSEYGGCYGGD